MKGLRKNKGGFSLLEVVVSITLVGLIAAPICSSIVLSHRMNAKSEALLQARLNVTSVVEELQAKGYYHDPEDNETYASIYSNVVITLSAEDTDYTDGYKITVADKVPDGERSLVSITTVVKAALNSPTENAEEGKP